MAKKMPAILFFGGDWLKDPAVRCVSLAARGLWIDMLCLMYESPKRGHLSLANGNAVGSTQLARMVGASIEEIETLLEEMRQCGVFSETDEGVIFSRRMVADEITRENKARAGRKGAESKWNGKPMADAMSDAMAEVCQNNGRDDGKGVAPLDIVTDTAIVIDNTYNSSNSYLEKRKSRELRQPDEVEVVFHAIPPNKINNPSKTRLAIMNALDRSSSGDGESRCIAAGLLADRVAAYYFSDEGQSEYFKAPHNWLDEDCHLADPSAWTARSKPKPTTGWDSVERNKS